MIWVIITVFCIFVQTNAKCNASSTQYKIGFILSNSDYVHYDMIGIFELIQEEMIRAKYDYKYEAIKIDSKDIQKSIDEEDFDFLITDSLPQSQPLPFEVARIAEQNKIPTFLVSPFFRALGALAGYKVSQYFFFAGADLDNQLSTLWPLLHNRGARSILVASLSKDFSTFMPKVQTIIPQKIFDRYNFTYLYENSLTWLEEESNRPEEFEEKMFDWVESFQTIDVDILYVNFGGGACLRGLERIHQVHKDKYKAIVTSACDVKASEPYLQYVIESKQIFPDTIANNPAFHDQEDLNLFRKPEDEKHDYQYIYNQFIKKKSRPPVDLEIDIIANYFMLHASLRAARKDSCARGEYSAYIRNSVYVSPIGPLAIHSDGYNHLLQIMFAQNMGQSHDVFFPETESEVEMVYPMPLLEDRKCSPQCAECYNDICTQLTTILFIALISSLGFFALFGAGKYYLSEQSIYDSFSEGGFISYALLEIIAATCGIISIMSVRKSAQQMALGSKIIIIVWSAVDGMCGLMKLIFLSFEWNGVQLLDEIWRYGIDCILGLVNISGICVLMLLMSKSTNQTSSTMPVLLDVIVNLVEVILVVLSPTLKVIMDGFEQTHFAKVSQKVDKPPIIDQVKKDNSPNEPERNLAL